MTGGEIHRGGGEEAALFPGKDFDGIKIDPGGEDIKPRPPILA